MCTCCKHACIAAFTLCMLAAGLESGVACMHAGAKGPLVEEEAKLLRLRQEIEGEAREELQRRRQQLEDEARQALWSLECCHSGAYGMYAPGCSTPVVPLA